MHMICEVWTEYTMKLFILTISQENFDSIWTCQFDHCSKYGVFPLNTVVFHLKKTSCKPSAYL